MRNCCEPIIEAYENAVYLIVHTWCNVFHRFWNMSLLSDLNLKFSNSVQIYLQLISSESENRSFQIQIKDQVCQSVYNKEVIPETDRN